MAIVQVAKELMTAAVSVKIAKDLDPAAVSQDPAPTHDTASQPAGPQEEDLINKHRIVQLVQDHHNKIDRLTVVEEKGGKKKVSFEVSPQGILRPNAQQPQPMAQAPATQPMPATASSDTQTQITAKKKTKKKWDPNPWAVCHKSVGPEKSDKFEKCVQDVKKKQASVEFPSSFLNAMGIGDEI